MAEIATGTLVAGKYRVTSLIGKGESAVVYAANYIENSAPIALKVLASELSTSREYQERFQREAQILAHLQHPNIVKIYDFGRTEDGLLYMAMEPINGQTMRQTLDRHPRLDVSKSLALLEQLISAIETAHAAGVIHRDIRPGNIMLKKGDDGNVVLKVLDFGVARTEGADAKALTSFGTMLGQPEYAAPEQLVGGKVDARTDVYGVGCLAFHMITGAPPFTGESRIDVIFAKQKKTPPTLAERLPGERIPAGLEEWFARALATAQDHRFPDATRMRMTLGGIRAGMTAKQPEIIGEQVVPLGGEVLPGYVDMVGAPARTNMQHPTAMPKAVPEPAPIAARAPARAASPAPAAPASNPRQVQRTERIPAHGVVGESAGKWKMLVIAMGVALLAAIAVVAYLLTK